MRLMILFVALSFITTTSYGQWYPQQSSTGKDLQDVFFLDSNTGWASGAYYLNSIDTVLLYTGDGGTSWSDIATDYPLEEIQFTSDSLGWAINATWFDQKLLKTTDGGQSWEISYDGNVYAFEFFNQNEGYFYVDGNAAYKTIDGGNSWNTFPIPIQVTAMDFLNMDMGYAATWGEQFPGPMHKTVDGGQNWQQIDHHGSLKLCFIDEMTGFSLNKGAVGTGFNSDRRILFKTTDGANTWNVIYNVEDYIKDTLIIAFHFINENCGWIAVNNGWYEDEGYSIKSTCDGGLTWVTQYSSDAGFLWDIYFTDNMNGWAVGNDGLILHTSNGGGTVGIGQENPLADECRIEIYPNPADQYVTVEWSCPERMKVEVSIIDPRGCLKGTICRGVKEKGQHKIIRDISNLPGGIYLIHFKTETRNIIRKFIKI